MTERTCTTHSTERYQFVSLRSLVRASRLMREFRRNSLAGWYRLIVSYALRKRLMDDGLEYARQALAFLQSRPVCSFRSFRGALSSFPSSQNGFPREEIAW